MRARMGEPGADLHLIKNFFDGTVLAEVISTTVYALGDTSTAIADTVDEVALKTTGSCVPREAA